MPRPANAHPTDGELEILQVLWSEGSVALGVVCETLRQQREVAATTVATMLRVMSDKGLVKRTGSGRTAAWSAIVSQQKVERGMLRKLVDGVFDGAADRLVTHLVAGGELSPGQLLELRKLIDRQSAAARPKKEAAR